MQSPRDPRATSLSDADDAPLVRAKREFEKWCGESPTLAARAPGRVNLIGEHTDYNHGFVLPCALPFDTVAVATRRPGSSVVRARSADWPGTEDVFDLKGPIEPLPHGARNAWANYVRGVAAVLRGREHTLGGLDLVVAGDVPQGAGLSSSAALEVALGELFRSAFHLELQSNELALVGHETEHRFAGVRCGIMDQLVSALGRAGHALLIDCRDLTTRQVPIPADVSVLVVHSRVRRCLVDSAFNKRRVECEQAAHYFCRQSLREVDEAELEADAAGLDPLLLRRARHVVLENRRTLDAADALQSGDLVRLGALMAASHASLRDQFEVSHPSVDRLVELVQGVLGPEGGARMTGGGFGGCVVGIAPHARVADVRGAVAAHYRSPEGAPATLWECSAADGAGPLPVV